MGERSFQRYITAGCLGLCCVVLQHWSISYRVAWFGQSVVGSLAHLHTGALLALALLFRDRLYFRVAFVVLTISWYFRAWHEASIAVLAGMLFVHAAMYAWIAACARWIAIAPGGEAAPLKTTTVMRFAVVGLLVMPLGYAVTTYAVNLLDANPAGAISDAIQVLFAKHFGVSIVTLPFVLLMTERARERIPLNRSDALMWLLLLGGLGANVLVSMSLRAGPTDLLADALDYRFALVAILTWCALRLEVVAVAPALVAVQLVLVFGLSRAMPELRDAGAALGLLKIAFELSVLQLLVVLLLVLHRDASDRLEILRAQTRRDAITGLPNVHALRAALRARASPPSEIGYLVIANIDRLAGGFGLRAQEALMNSVARCVADRADAYHMGSGQIALLPRAATLDWAGVLRALGEHDFHYAGESLRLVSYLGVATVLDDDSEHLDDSLDAAATAAQDASLRGETQPVHAFPEREHGEHSRGLSEADTASLALARVRAGELELHFQPIVPLRGDDREPVRFGEILCRLRSANGLLLRPHAFLRELELRGRGAEFDLAVVDALFRWLRERGVDGALPRFGINLTGRSLVSDRFRDALMRRLDDAPIPPDALCFEISESTAIARMADARTLLDALRARGCRIALDDFGTGMQSFGRLGQLPFDLLKIDGSLVRGVAEASRDYQLVCAAVAVARAAGAETVAENVETADAAERLRELGVDWAQGDHFGSPAPLAMMIAMEPHG